MGFPIEKFMSDQDLHTLLGGYATNTLTKEERDALFSAALHDQQLFDALANEHALRELLEDAEARARIVAALEASSAQGESPGFLTGIFNWFRQPTNLGWAGSLATVLIAVLAVNYFWEEAKFPTSEEKSLEEQTLEAEKPPPPSGSRSERKELHDDQETRMKDSSIPLESPSAPPIMQEAEPSSASSFRTDKDTPEKKKESHRKTQSNGLPKSPNRNQPLGKRSQGTRSQDVPQSPAADRKLTSQLQAAQKSLPSATAPPLEQSPTIKPMPAPNGYAELHEDNLYQGQETDLQGVGSAQESQAKARASEYAKIGKARDQFYAGMKKEDHLSDSLSKMDDLNNVSTGALGLRYTVLKRDQQGQFKEVSPNGPFSPEDTLHFTIELNREGYVYVLNKREGESWLLLYPTFETQQGRSESEPLAPFRRIEIPIPSLRSPLPIVIIVSESEPLDIQELQNEGGQNLARAFIDQVRTTSKKHTHTMERVSQATEQATYIITSASLEASSLVVEVTLPLQKP